MSFQSGKPNRNMRQTLSSAEFLNTTKTIPSSNPLRTSSPDNLKAERINQTRSPSQDRRKEASESSEIKILQNLVKEREMRITVLERTLQEASQGKINDKSYKDAIERLARENSKLDAENKLLREDVEYMKVAKNSGIQGESSLVSELQRQLADARSDCKKLQEKLAAREEELAEVQRENSNLKRVIAENERHLLSRSNDENMKELVRKMSSYKSDNEKLSLALQEKLKELEAWKNTSRKSSELEKTLSLQREEIEQLNSLLNDKMKENEDLHTRLVLLESAPMSRGGTEELVKSSGGENELLKKTVAAQTAEMDILKYRLKLAEENPSKSELYELKIRELVHELDEKKKEKVAFEHQKAVFLKEITDLEVQLRESMTYSSKSRSEVEKRNQHQEEAFVRAKAEAEEWKLKYQSLERIHSELKSSASEMHGVLENEMNKNEILERELMKIKGILEMKLSENEKLRKKAEEFEEKVMRRSASASTSDRRSYESLLEENIKLKSLLETKLQELDILKTQLMSVQQDSLDKKMRESEDFKRGSTTSSQGHKEALMEENRKLKQIIEDQLSEIRQLRERVVDMGQAQLRQSEYEGKVIQMEKEITRLREQLDSRRLISDSNRMDSSVVEYEIDPHALQESRRDQEDSQTKVRLLGEEIERLNDLLKQNTRKYSIELGQVRDENAKLGKFAEDLSNEKNDLIRKIKRLEENIAMLSTEVERLNDLAKTKARESSNSRVQVDTSIKEENVKLKFILEEKLREIDIILIKEKEQEGHIFMLTKEIERLNEMLKRQSKQSFKPSSIEEDVVSMKRFLEDKSRELDDLRNKERTTYIPRLKEYEDKIVMLSSELERLNNNNRTRTSVNEKNEAEVGRLTSLLQESQRKKEDMNEIYQRELREKDEAIRSLRGKLLEYEEKIALLSTELERRVQEGFNSSRELDSIKSRYEEELSYLSSDNKRLNDLLNDKNNELLLLRTKTNEYEEITFRQREEISTFRSIGLNKEEELRKQYEDRERSISDENREMRIKIDEYQAMLEDNSQEIRTQREKLFKYEESISMLSTELERYRQQDFLMKEELNALRNRGREFETNRSEQLTELISMRNEIEDKNRTISALHSEIALIRDQNQKKASDYETLYHELVEIKEERTRIEARSMSLVVQEREDKIRIQNENEQKIVMLSLEIQRLNAELSSNESLRRSKSELEGRVRYQEEAISKLERSLLEERSLNKPQKIDTESENLILELRRRDRDISEENKKLRILLEEKLREVDYYQEKENHLGSEYEKLKREYQVNISQFQSEIKRSYEMSRVEIEKYTRKSESELRISKIGEEYKDKTEYLTGLLLLLVVEIERLGALNELKNTEIESLTLERVQLENKITQLIEELGSVQDQVSNNLAEKHEFENKMSLLAAEIEHLRYQLGEKDKEMRSISQAVESLQRDKDSFVIERGAISIERDNLVREREGLQNNIVMLTMEIERLKTINEEREKNFIVSQNLRESIERSNFEKINVFEARIANQTFDIQQKQNEISRLEIENQALRTQNTDKDREISSLLILKDSLTQEREELHLKLMMLATEVERLLAVNEEKEKTWSLNQNKLRESFERSTWEKVTTVESRLAEQTSELQNRRQDIAKLESDIAYLKNLNSQKDQNLSDIMKSKDSVLREKEELQNKVTILNFEVERLLAISEEKEKSWSVSQARMRESFERSAFDKLNTFETRLNTQSNELQQRMMEISRLEEEIRKKDYLYSEKERDFANLQHANEVVKREKEDLLMKIAILSKEIERLQNLDDEKERNWVFAQAKMRESIERSNNEKVFSLDSRINNQSLDLQQKLLDIARLESEIDLLKTQIADRDRELSIASLSRENLSRDREDLQYRITMLTTEIERLRAINEEKDKGWLTAQNKMRESLERSNFEKLTLIETRYSSQTLDIQQKVQDIIRLENEIQNLRTLSADKDRELSRITVSRDTYLRERDSLAKEKEELLGKFFLLISEIERLRFESEESEKNLYMARSKIRESLEKSSNDKVNLLESKLLTQSTNLLQREEQMMSLHSEIEFLRGQIPEKEKALGHKELEISIVRSAKDNILREKELLLSENAEMQNKISFLLAEIDHLRLLNEEKERNWIQSQSKIRESIEKSSYEKITVLETRIVQQSNELQQRQNDELNLKMDIEQLRAQIESKEREMAQRAIFTEGKIREKESLSKEKIELQNQIALLASEIERLRLLLEEKEKNLASAQLKIRESFERSTFEKVNILESQLASKSVDLQQRALDLSNLESERENLKKQIFERERDLSLSNINKDSILRERDALLREKTELQNSIAILASEIERLRNINENNERNNMISQGQMKETLERPLVEKISALENKITAINLEALQKNQQIVRLESERADSEHLKRQLDDRDKELVKQREEAWKLKEQLQQKEDYELKMMSLAEELERANAEKEDYLRHFIKSEEELRHQEHKKRSLLGELNKQRGEPTSRVSADDDERANSNIKLQQLTLDLERKDEQLRNSLDLSKELEINIVLLTTEINRLHDLERVRHDDQKYADERESKLRLNYEQKIGQLNAEITRLNEKIYIITKETEEKILIIKESERRQTPQEDIRPLKILLEERDKEISDLKFRSASDSINYSEHIKDYENKIFLLGTEIERLTDVLNRQRIEDNASLMKLTKAVEELEVTLVKKENELRDAELIGKKQTQENTILRTIVEEKVKEVRVSEGYALPMRQSEGFMSLDVSMLEYENKVSALNHEIDRLNQEIRVFKEKGEVALLKENSIQKERITQLLMVLFLFMVELERVAITHSNGVSQLRAELQNEREINEQNDSRIRENQASLLKLATEIEDLTRIVKEKTKENQLIKSQFEVNIREERSRRSAQQIQGQSLIDYEARIRECNERNELLARELENMRALLKKKSEETETWVTRFTELQLKFGDKEALLMENTKLKIYVDDINNEVQSHRMKLLELQTLQEKLREYENKILMLTSEIERLLRANKDKTGDYEHLTKSVIELEQRLTALAEENMKVNELLEDLKKRKLNETEDLRQDIERYRGQVTSLSEQLASKSNEFILIQHKINADQLEIAKISILIDENQKLRFLLEKKLGEMDELASDKSQALIKLKELENSLLLLTTEVERLNDELLNKIKDVDMWKNNYQQVQIGVKDRDALVEENSRMRLILQDYKNEVESLRAKTKESGSFTIREKELETKIVLLVSENQRLDDLWRSKSKDHDELQKKHLRLVEESKSRDTSPMRNSDLKVVEDTKKLKQVLLEKLKEVDSIRNRESEIRDQEINLREKEAKTIILAEEVERLRTEQRRFTNEIEEWKRRYETVTVRVNDREGLLEENSRIRMLLDDARKEVEELRNKARDSNSSTLKLKEYENRVLLLTAEVERLNESKRALERELDSKIQALIKNEKFASSFEEINIENQKLKFILKEKLTEIDTLKEGQIQMLETRIVLICAEVDRLQYELRRKIDIDQEEIVKRKSNTVEVNAVRESSKLKNIVETLRKENGDLKSSVDKNREYDFKIRDHESARVFLTHQLTQTKEELIKLREENEKLKRGFRDLELDRNIVEEENKRYKKLLEIRPSYRGDEQVDTLNLELNDRSKIIEYESDIMRLSEDLGRLNTQLTQKNKQIDTWAKEKNELETRKEIERLQNQLYSKTTELEALKRNENLQSSAMIENKKLRYLLEEKLKELDELREKELIIIERENEINMLKSENKHANHLLQQSALTSDLNSKDKDSNLIRDQKIFLLATEVDRLNYLLKQRESEGRLSARTDIRNEIKLLAELAEARKKECDEWKFKFQELSSRMNLGDRNQAFETMVSEYRLTREDFQNKFSELMRENAELSAEISRLQGQNQSSIPSTSPVRKLPQEEQLYSLLAQNDKLNLEIKRLENLVQSQQRLSEDRIGIDNRELFLNTTRTADLEIKNKLLNQEVLELRGKLTKLEKDYTDQISQNLVYRSSLGQGDTAPRSVNLDENRSVHSSPGSEKTEKMLEYEEHIKSLLDINKRLNEELLMWQDRYKELSLQKNSSPKKEERLSFGVSSTNLSNQGKEMIFILDKEKRAMLSPKLGGISFNGGTSFNGASSGQISDCGDNEWKAKFHVAEHNNNILASKLRDYEIKLGMVTSELEKVNEALRIKLKEVDSLRKKSGSREVSPSTNGNRQQTGESTPEEKNLTLQSENDRLSLLLRDRQYELTQLKALIGELELRLKEKDAVDFENRKLKALVQNTIQEGEDMQRRMSNYENQGQAFTELSTETFERKLKEKDLKSNLLQTDLDRVNQHLSIKAAEVQDLNGKLQDYDNSLREKRILEKEKLKLREILAQKLEENENHVKKIYILETKVFELISLGQRYEEAFERINFLEGELAEKNRLLNENAYNIGSIDFNNKERIALQREINDLKIHLNTKYSENEGLKHRINDLTSHTPQISELLRANDDKDAQIQKYLTEFNRLNNIIKKLEEEKQSWRAKYFKGEILPGSNRPDNFAFEEQKKLHSLLEERNREVEHLRVIQADLQGKIFDYESKIEILLSRLEQGNSLLEEKLSEAMKLQFSSTPEYSNIMVEISKLETMAKEFEKRENLLKETLLQTSRDGQQARDKCSKLEEILIIVNAEIERLLLENSYLIEQLEKRGDILSVEKFFERVDALRASNNGANKGAMDQLQKRIKELEEQVQNWRLKCVEQTIREQGYSQMEIKIREYEEKLVLLSNELSHAQTLIQEKFRENTKLGEQLVYLELQQQQNTKSSESNSRFGQLLEEHVRVNEELRRQKDECDLEKERLQSRVNHYEEKLQVLLSEVDGLSQILREYQSGQRSSLDTSGNFSYSISQHPLASEVAQLREQVQMKSNEAREWQQKYITLDMNSAAKDIYEKLHDYEERIALFTSEFERLDILLKDKTVEVEDLRNKNIRVEQIEREKEILLAQTLKLNEIIAARVNEIEDMKKKYQRIEVDLLDKIRFTERASEYETRLEGVMSENQRLSQLVNVKFAEIEELRQQASLAKLFENENANLKEELLRTREISERRVKDGDQVFAAKSQIELLITERGTLSYKVKEYSQRVDHISKELERVTGLLNNKTVEADELRFKLAANIILLEDREKKMSEYQRLQELFVMAKIEIERLSSISRLFYSNDAPNSVATSNANQIEFSEVTVQLNSELEFWRNKCSELEVKLIENTAIHQGESDKDSRINWLEDILKRKNDEINDWRMKYAKLDARTWSMEQMQANIDELQGVIAKLCSDNERLTEVITEKGTDFAMLASKSERLQNDLRENYLVQREVDSLKEQLRVQLNHLANLESDLNDLRGKNQILLSEKAKYVKCAEDEIDKNAKLLQTIDSMNREKQQLIEENLKTRGRSHSPNGPSSDVSSNTRLNELTKLNMELRVMMADQERKMLKLVAETERLHAFSETKVKEGKFWKSKYEELDEMHKKELKKITTQNEERLKSVIEMERKTMALNLVNEKQRLESGFNNDKWKMVDRAVYNEEVLKYKSRMVKIEEGIAYATSENEGLKKLIDDQRRENDILKAKIVEINTMHTQNIQRMREQFNILIKQYLGQELARVRHYHVKEREKVERELSMRFAENDSIKQDMTKLRIENQSLKSSNVFTSKSIVIQPPEQVLHTLIEKIHVEPLMRSLETEQDKIAFSRFRSEYDPQIKETMKVHIESLQRTHQIEVDSLQAKIKSLEETLNNATFAFTNELESLKKTWELQINEAIEERFQELTMNYTSEKYTLHENNIVKQIEIDNLRKRLHSIEEERRSELTTLQTQIRELGNYREGNAEFEAERAAMEASILQLRVQVEELQRILDVKDIELNRLREKISNERAYQEELVNRISVKGNEIDDLRQEKQELKREQLDAKETIMKMENQKKIIELQIINLKTTLFAHKEQVDQLYQIIEDRKKERDELIRENMELRNKNITITREKGELLENLDTYHNELEILNKAIGDINDDSLANSSRHSNELSKINQVLIQRLKELDILKLTFHEALSKVKNLEKKLLDRIKEGEILFKE